MTANIDQVHRMKLLAPLVWISGATRKPKSKQATTALDQKSRFISTTVLRVLTNFGEFILPQYATYLREIWRVILYMP